MKAYLGLRLRTQWRQLRELGWWRGLVLGMLLLPGLRKLAELLVLYPAGRWAWPLGLVLVTIGQHRQRTDLTFLQLAAPQYRSWLAVEYALLALLGSLPVLAYGQWAAALLAVALVPLMAWLPAATQRAAGQRRSLFRSEAFEWVSGMRQLGGWWLWVGLLGAALWQRQQPMVAAACLVVWVLLVSSFYCTPEPIDMLLTEARSAARWLRKRVFWAAFYLLLTAVPFLFVVAAAGAGGAAAALLCGWSLLVLTAVVLAKYTFYPHVVTMRFIQGAVVALSLLILVDSTYLALFMAALSGLMWRCRYRLQAYRYA